MYGTYWIVHACITSCLLEHIGLCMHALLHAFFKHVSMEWLHIDSPNIRPKLKS